MARYMEELSEEKKVEIKRRLDEYLRQYHEDPDNLEEELKLDDLDVVPYRVWKYLEELGWEQSGCDRNGWEMDFYISFKKEGEPKLQLRGSGMYGGLYMYSAMLVAVASTRFHLSASWTSRCIRRLFLVSTAAVSSSTQNWLVLKSTIL